MTNEQLSYRVIVTKYAWASITGDVDGDTLGSIDGLIQRLTDPDGPDCLREPKIIIDLVKGVSANCELSPTALELAEQVHGCMQRFWDAFADGPPPADSDDLDAAIRAALKAKIDEETLKLKGKSIEEVQALLQSSLRALDAAGVRQERERRRERLERLVHDLYEIEELIGGLDDSDFWDYEREGVPDEEQDTHDSVVLACAVLYSGVHQGDLPKFVPEKKRARVMNAVTEIWRRRSTPPAKEE